MQHIFIRQRLRDLLTDRSGAQVISGKGLCRHQVREVIVPYFVLIVAACVHLHANSTPGIIAALATDSPTPSMRPLAKGSTMLMKRLDTSRDSLRVTDRPPGERRESVREPVGGCVDVVTSYPSGELTDGGDGCGDIVSIEGPGFEEV